jgi:hypothetical protein
MTRQWSAATLMANAAADQPSTIGSLPSEPTARAAGHAAGWIAADDSICLCRPAAERTRAVHLPARTETNINRLDRLAGDALFLSCEPHVFCFLENLMYT